MSVLRWLVQQGAAALVRYAVITVFLAVCLIWGFSPAEWLQRVIANPPPWLTSPLTRLGVVVVGIVIVGGAIILEPRFGRTAFKRRRRRQLQDFYIRLGSLIDRRFDRSQPNIDQLFEAYVAETNQAVSEMASWVETNMGAAAKARLLDRTGMMAASVQGALNERHNSVLLNLDRWRANVLAMIEGDWS